MYSRNSDRHGAPLQIPRNYSGCAFTATPSVKEERPIPVKEAIPVPPPFSKEEECRCTGADLPPSEPPAPCPTDGCGEKKLASPTLPPLLHSLGLHLPFSAGLGFDEILILALMLLLSRNESDPDVLLFLGILLFCG